MHRKNLPSLLLLLLVLGASAASRPRPNITTITQESVRGGGHGGGRLSLINHRFNSVRRPRKKHLDAGELKLVLGSSYDARFMSVEEPPAGKVSGPPLEEERWRRPFGEDVLREWGAGNLTRELQAAAEGTTLGPDHVRALERWLVKKASCPVRYAWEDIGALFWPRYIRRGECTTGTCSWPPGMHCVPSDTTHIHILRWQCRTPRGGKGARKKIPEDRPLNLKCKWVRVPYPITSECTCTC